MKKNELCQNEESNLENWTQYSTSVWQWIFGKDPLHMAFQPVLPPLVSFGLTMFPVWSQEHQVGQGKQPDWRQAIVSIASPSLKAS